jgi:hypothetical protein
MTIAISDPHAISFALVSELFAPDILIPSYKRPENA